MKERLENAVRMGCEIAHFEIYPKVNIEVEESDLVSALLNIGEYTIHCYAYNTLDVECYSIYVASDNKDLNMEMKDSRRLPYMKVRYYDAGENDFFLYNDDMDSDSLAKTLASIIRYIFNSVPMCCESGFYFGNEEMTKAFKEHEKFKVVFSRSNGCMSFKDYITGEVFWKTTKVIEYKRYENLYWYFKTKNTKYQLVPVAAK